MLPAVGANAPEACWLVIRLFAYAAYQSRVPLSSVIGADAPVLSVAVRMALASWYIV